MKKLLKKSISVLLAAVLLLTVIPFAAAAAEPDRGGAFTVVATSNFFPEKRERPRRRLYRCSDVKLFPCKERVIPTSVSTRTKTATYLLPLSTS